MGESKGKSKRLVVSVIAGIAAIGGLLFGYDTGVISGAILFLKKDWSLGSFAQELVVSAVLVGAIIGAILSGWTADRIGRRKAIVLTALIFAIGSLGAAFAPSVEWLIAARVVLGIAIGIASCIVPLYISEISPASIRGALVSLNQLAITVGIVVSYLSDALFAHFTDTWRLMFLAGILPAVILLIGMIFLPESPRWLMGRKRDDEALQILKRVSGEEAVLKEAAEIRKAIETESKAGWSDLLVPYLRPVLLIGIGIMFVQQMTGINTVIYYAPTIFEMAGFKDATVAIAATVGVGVVNVLMTLVSIWLLDKVGRKPLLSIGLIGMTLSLGLLGLAFMETQALGGMLRWICVGGIFLYIASFAVSLGPIGWLLISEIYPLRVRGLAMSVATVANWTFNFVVALTFLTIVDKLGATGAFWLYAFFGIAGWLFCRFFVPETKGRTLEEIEGRLKEGVRLREL